MSSLRERLRAYSSMPLTQACRLLKHAASQPIALIPGVSMPTEMMEAMDLGYDGCNK
ncbi:hypothetical protein [Vibrio sp. PNB23_22_7]